MEILTVMVVLGVLVGIAWGKYNNSKEKALEATLVSDIRNLATAQELYHREHEIYASTAAEIDVLIHPSPASSMHITAGTNMGWAAWNEIEGTTMRCELYVGSDVTSPLGYSAQSERIACYKEGAAAGQGGAGPGNPPGNKGGKGRPDNPGNKGGKGGPDNPGNKGGGDNPGNKGGNGNPPGNNGGGNGNPPGNKGGNGNPPGK